MPIPHHRKPIKPQRPASALLPTSSPPEKSKGGRVSRLQDLIENDPELYDRMISYIRAGAYFHVAAAAVGISADTFSSWLAKGRKAKTGIYARFLGAVLRAVGEAAVVAEADVKRTKPEVWLRSGARRLLGPEWQETAAPATSVRIEAHNAMILTEEQTKSVLQVWESSGVMLPESTLSEGDQSI